jgi:diguanylate cyclase (GGDEF)-like protein
LLTSAHQTEQPLSFILFDIDHFKLINDRYGHSVGDFALQHVIAVCQQCLPDNALLGRYGGEEFAIALPDTPLEQAGQAAERLRKEIAGNPLYSAAKTISITASFGVTQARTADVPLEALLSEADIALYRSKHSGRNAVHLSSPEYVHTDEEK